MGMEKIISIEKINLKTRPHRILYDIQIEGGDTFALNGIVIHNSAVEFGIEQDIPIEGTQVVKVRSYRRRDGAIVKEHVAKYVNKRLIPIRPKFSKFEWGEKMFRVINKIKARPGQYFLSRAVMEGLKDLTKDIKFYLDKIGG